MGLSVAARDGSAGDEGDFASGGCGGEAERAGAGAEADRRDGETCGGDGGWYICGGGCDSSCRCCC